VKNQHKIILIIPYYGTFPEYLHAWLLSVSYNPDVDFLLVTDIQYKNKYPENVKVLNWSFEKLIKEIQTNFDFPINITRPYKLCDYKLAYGLIFQKHITQYDFWGYCDIDQVFGSIRNFIQNDILDNYDFIELLGHFSLHKNNGRVNNFFKMDGSLYGYKKAFSTSRNCNFSETTGKIQIILKNNFKYYHKPDSFADLSRWHKKIMLVDNSVCSHKHQIFFWENGKAYMAYVADEKVCVKEFMYIHFQKKNPKIEFKDVSDVKSFYCFADKFVIKNEGPPTKEFIYKHSNYRGALREKIERTIAKFKLFFKRYVLLDRTRKRILLDVKMSGYKILKPKVTESRL